MCTPNKIASDQLECLFLSLAMPLYSFYVHKINEYNEHHEIVSLVGTLSNNDASHLHISISDKNGLVKGGHVMSGCKVFTTAEVVLGVLNDLKYTREYCEQSGFDELVVVKKENK
jgi:uncharacterized protein